MPYVNVKITQERSAETKGRIDSAHHESVVSTEDAVLIQKWQKDCRRYQSELCLQTVQMQIARFNYY